MPADPRVRWWARSDGGARAARARRADASTDDPAAILFSGGTTGVPKGIVLSNRNFIAEGMQAAAWGGMGEGDSILAILPIFHGFGLGVCVNAAFMAGGKSILVPQFSAEIVAKLLRTQAAERAGGRADALSTRSRATRRWRTADLSCLRACFCGADTLPRPVKERFEKLVAERGGQGEAARRLRAHRGGHGDHGDAAGRVSRRLDRHAASRTCSPRSAPPGTDEEAARRRGGRDLRFAARP